MWTLKFVTVTRAGSQPVALFFISPLAKNKHRFSNIVLFNVRPWMIFCTFKFPTCILPLGQNFLHVFIFCQVAATFTPTFEIKFAFGETHVVNTNFLYSIHFMNLKTSNMMNSHNSQNFKRALGKLGQTFSVFFRDSDETWSTLNVGSHHYDLYVWRWF